MALGARLVSRLLQRVGSFAADARRQAGARGEPLRAARFVALDLETTGLDPRRDVVVQIGMVGIERLAVEPEALMHTLVDPQRPIPPMATKVHGIADADVRGAPAIESLLPRIAELWREAVVIGHHVRFDLAVLAAAARRNGHRLPTPAFLDTWSLAAALDTRFVHRDLGEIATRFGIDAAAFVRHDALGDARLAGHLFVRLAERLIAAGHTTVGEAATLAERARLPR